MSSILPTQVERLNPVLFELRLPDGPNIAWRVVRVRGNEAISGAYEFVVDVITNDALTNYDEMLGSNCELLLDRIGVVRVIYGVIDEVEAVVSAQSRVAGAALVVRLRIVPAFKLLDQELDTRFFAGHTVVEIVRDLLTPALQTYGRTIDVTTYVKGTYNKRDYCVQYRESTFDFCNRILEDEGIAYVFVADEQTHKEKLVLIDNNANYPGVELLHGDDIPIVLHRFDELDRESIQGLDWRDARTPNKVTTRGYNFKVPEPFDEGFFTQPDAHHGTVREHYFDDDLRQIVDDPINDPDAHSFTGTSLNQRAPLAERLLQRRTLEASVGHGQGNAIGFGAGITFILGEHPRSNLDHHQFLLTRVRHEGVVSESGPAEGSYTNVFECTPIEREFRPERRTRRPRVYGIQTGVVVGRGRDEIYTDQFGRIRVKFHRDRVSGNDEQASCWIRVAQVWAGSGFGAVVIPRVGMEVVVSFVDGNPDCPIVTGCVYDGRNMPPYPLPSEMTKSTFKTNSSPGGNGYNELRFEDAKGSEQIFIHGQRRMDVRVRGSLYETNGGNREERIGWESGDEQGGDHNTLVHKDVNHHVKEVRYTKVEKQQYETVMLDLVEEFQTKHMVMVGELHQLSAPKVVVEATDLISNKAGTIKLSGSSTVAIKGGGKVALESNNSIELKVGGSFISITPSEIAIQAVSVRINSGGGVGAAAEADAAVSVEMLDPLDALAADDGRIHHGGGGGGGGGARTRGRRTLEPHHAPPMQPPPPPPPGHPTVRPDGTLREFLTIEWAEAETWCSEPATLRGTTQNYADGDTESADVRNAADGAVERSVTLRVTGNAYSQPFDVVNLLPRRVGANFELERTLDAIAVGRTTPTPIRLRFIPTLTNTHCSIGISHFDMSVTNYQVQIGGTINYVPGWIQFIIQLGATVPAGTGGNCGVNFGAANPAAFSGTDWRYAKRSTTTGGLLYWNGTAWTAVPATWTDPLSVKLYPIALWVEGGTNHTQFGTTPWPEAIPAWGATETTLATTTLATWTTNIASTWTNKFDLKRRECRSTDAQCCRYKTRAAVTFVQVAVKGSGIVLAANNARSNAGVWSLGDNRPGMPPHEFGHHLGNPDEYAGGVGIDASVNTDGATAGIDPNSIMGSGLSTVKRRHYNTICQHLAAMVSTQFGRSYHYDAVPVV